MRQKFRTRKAPAKQVVKDIRRATRKQYGAEEKIRIVLEGIGAAIGIEPTPRPGEDENN